MTAHDAGVQRKQPAPGIRERLRSLLTERNFLVGLVVLFVAMSVWVASVPYDPMQDIADATTNVIWSEYYREGKLAVPYSEWKADGRPGTQSSVVVLDGEPYVVNEKGPAHALIAMVLGPATGMVLAAVATAATYMLGRRLFGWPVGAIASVLVLTNLTVVAMWYRHWWVDASTMPLLALGMWLLVESAVRLRPAPGTADRRTLAIGAALGAAGGLAFGTAVATRYTVGVVIVAVLLYILALFWRPLTAALRGRDARGLAMTVARMAIVLLPFVLGLLVVLVPLMSYNSTYFGGPLHSGYDATSLVEYERSGGTIDSRNQTEQLFMDPLGKLANVAHNTVALAPIMLSRMLALMFVPYAVWRLRRDASLALLVPWLLVIILGFLAMDWVDRYARVLQTPWEPRYHLPALPAVALLAGFAIHEVGRRVGGHAGNGARPRANAAFALTAVAIIALSGILPAETNFADVRENGMSNVPGGQPPPEQPTVVTVARMHAEAIPLNNKPVQLNRARVVLVERAGGTGQVLALQVRDPSSPLNLTVRPLDFPPGALPDIWQGQLVTVFGRCAWQDVDRDGQVDPGEPSINVKHGTPDHIVVEP